MHHSIPFATVAILAPVRTYVTCTASLCALVLLTFGVLRAETFYEEPGGVGAHGGASPSTSDAFEGAVLPHETPSRGPITWVDGGGLTPPWLCDFLSDCDGDYLAFSTLAGEHASLLSMEELDARFTASKTGPTAEPVAQSTLERVVRDALGVSFLFDDVGQLPLEVTHLATTQTPRYRQDYLLLSDPWLGTFPVRVLAPPGVDVRASGNHPSILFLTGHLDSADSLIDEYDGLTLVDAGYVVWTLEARADDGGATESWTAQTLLINGFSLMGLRAYEALVTLHLMQSAQGLDPSVVGLLGHSGGGALANVLVRLNPPFAAAIADHHADFYNIAEGQYVLCETIFDLIPYVDQISDPSTASMPMKRVEYGWPGGAGPLVRFFDQHLR